MPGVGSSYVHLLYVQVFEQQAFAFEHCTTPLVSYVYELATGCAMMMILQTVTS